MIAAKAMGSKNAGIKRVRASVSEQSEEVPMIVYNPYMDLDKYSGIARAYLLFAHDCLRLTSSDQFNGFVIGCICVAGVLVGVQTYPSLSSNAMLDGMDLGIVGVFLLESILKILSEGMAPWRYFLGKEWRWNNFDFVIVVLCLPVWGDTFGGGNVALLRMLRLMRVMKIVRKVPQLHMIVMGLIGGIKSIAYILILLFLVFYLYAIAGIYAFRSNDPWHFGNLFIALCTLFRMATLEDWTDVLYVNYFGCDEYDAGIYSMDPAKQVDGRYCNLTLLYGNKDAGQIQNAKALAKLMASFYFITFIVISALVMLSLFVGAITMSMTESMEQMKIAQEEADRKKVLERALKRQESTAKTLTDDDESKLSASDLHARKKLKAVLWKAWEGVDMGNDTTTDDAPMEDLTSIRGMYTKLSAMCYFIVEKPKFSEFVTYVIILAGVVVGLQTDASVNQVAGTYLQVVDIIILTVFTIEVVLKIVAEGFEPLRYFHSGWNSFDFVIVVGSFLPGSGSFLTVLRLLRLLRVLKLVKSLPQLQVIVSALLKGLGSIGYIGIIMLLVYYVFAIVGIILFRDNDPWHFGTLHFSMITLFRCATLEDWTDVMYINMYGCDSYGYDYYKIQGYTCIHTPQPVLSAAYFTIVVIIGALVLITLFIGVVTTSMEEATQEMNAELEIKERILKIKTEKGLDDETIAVYEEVFTMLDLDKSGSIEEDELRIGLATIGKHPTKKEMYDMMVEVDEDASGQIDLAEFVEFMANLKKSNTCRRSSMTDLETTVDPNKKLSVSAAVLGDADLVGKKHSVVNILGKKQDVYLATEGLQDISSSDDEDNTFANMEAPSQNAAKRGKRVLPSG